MRSLIANSSIPYGISSGPHSARHRSLIEFHNPMTSSTYDASSPLATASQRVPWNRGKIIGAKPPLQPNTSGRSGPSYKSTGAFADLALFNRPSTAISAAATWSH